MRTGVPLDEGNYKESFQEKCTKNKYIKTNINILPKIAIKDIDGGKSPEILFALDTIGDIKDDILYCFSKTGDVLWQHRCGREIAFSGRSYSDQFIILGFPLKDLNIDGISEILIISNHKHNFPGLATFLNSDGRINKCVGQQPHRSPVNWDQLDDSSISSKF